MTPKPAAHTPTPWKLINDDEIVTTQNRLIASCMEGVTENNHANAAFIVRAVNAHEELVEALKKSLVYVQMAEPIDTQLEVTIVEAIARAEEK